MKHTITVSFNRPVKKDLQNKGFRPNYAIRFQLIDTEA